MRGHRTRGGVAVGLVVAAAALGGVCGCAPRQESAGSMRAVADSVLRYVKWRFEDACEAVDVGVTFSTRPQFALYGDFASVAPGGYGHVDGYFVGLGGGRIGPMRHYQASLGLLAWGYEEVGWGGFDKRDLTTVNYQGVGALGLLAPPYGRPASAPA